MYILIIFFTLYYISTYDLIFRKLALTHKQSYHSAHLTRIHTACTNKKPRMNTDESHLNDNIIIHKNVMIIHILIEHFQTSQCYPGTF